MVELLLGVKVSVEIETNKQTKRKNFNLEDYDNYDSLLEDVSEWTKTNKPEE